MFSGGHAANSSFTPLNYLPVMNVCVLQNHICVWLRIHSLEKNNKKKPEHPSSLLIILNRAASACCTLLSVFTTQDAKSKRVKIFRLGGKEREAPGF